MSKITQLLQARYGDAAPASTQPDNPVLESLLSHRTVRHFLTEPLPQGTLPTLIAAAQSAASSSNLQSWSLISVEDPQQRAHFARLCGDQGHIAQAPLLLIWLADLNRAKRIADDQEKPSDGLHYFDTFLTAVVDAALAAQNLVVAAESLGLGTVYIGALRNNIEEVSRVLELPEQVFPLLGLVVGIPDPQQPAAIKPRLPQAAIAFSEQYAIAPQQEAITRYNTLFRQFQKQQQLPEIDWATQLTERLGHGSQLKGRVRLREIVENQLGFPLL